MAPETCDFTQIPNEPTDLKYVQQTEARLNAFKHTTIGQKHAGNIRNVWPHEPRQRHSDCLQDLWSEATAAVLHNMNTSCDKTYKVYHRTGSGLSVRSFPCINLTWLVLINDFINCTQLVMTETISYCLGWCTCFVCACIHYMGGMFVADNITL